MRPTRRQMLIGVAALVALPVPTVALGAGSAPDLVAHVQSIMLGFDMGAVVARAATMAGIPKRHIEAWKAVVGVRFAGLGLRGMDVLEADAKLSAAVDAVLDDAWGSLRVKLRLRRLIRDLDPRPEAVQPWVDRIASELFGLDVAGLRAHREGLNKDGLLIVYGGATSTMDLGSLLLSDLMTLFLEAVHGRRAEVLTIRQPRGEVLRRLLDPEVRVVCLVGHGEWDKFGMSGVAGTPGHVWSTLVPQLQANLQKAAGSLASGRVDQLLPYQRGELNEWALNALVKGWYASDDAREAAKKDLFVRYTCGTARFPTRGFLIWELLPEALLARTHIGRWGRAVSPKAPDDAAWEQDISEFLQGRPVVVESSTALGTSLVRDPHNTRGYDGLSWLDDFIDRPIPQHLPDPPFVELIEDTADEAAGSDAP